MDGRGVKGWERWKRVDGRGWRAGRGGLMEWKTHSGREVCRMLAGWKARKERK